MQKLKAYRIFELEMKELDTFLSSTRFAFEKVVQIKDFIKHKGNNQYLNDNGFDTEPFKDFSFKKEKVIKLERRLNEQTLIKAISALEVLLVDIFRDIFIITKTPFKDQEQTLRLSKAYILSIKDISELYNDIISKECRSLSSGGFNEIIKAYKKKLKIDLLHLPPGKQKMIEYHERRHLIIHRLGRTDLQYRSKYNIENKGGISIDNEYLKNCIKDVCDFAKQTHELVINKLRKLTESTNQDINYERKVRYIIEILKPSSNLDFLETEFEFWVNDEFEVLKNILVDKKTISQNKYEYLIAGKRREIRSYYKQLKYAKKKRIINVEIFDETKNSSVKVDTSKKKNQNPITVDETTIELIRNQLPEQPWETGIHKKIAEKLGIKNRIITIAIHTLIKRGIFKNQVNGVLIEDKKQEA